MLLAVMSIISQTCCERIYTTLSIALLVACAANLTLFVRLPVGGSPQTSPPGLFGQRGIWPRDLEGCLFSFDILG